MFSGNNFLMESFDNKLKKGGQIVVVCFGTPTVNGDSFGPRVGSFLKENNLPCFVYGTLENPVTARNMEEYISFVRRVHEGDVILSVDASLGKCERVGKIAVRTDGVCPAGIKGEKRRFGDVGVLGVVGDKDTDHISALLTANIDKVSKMADKVAIMIKEAVEQILACTTKSQPETPEIIFK